MSVKKAVVVFKGDYGRPPNHYSKTVINGIISEAALTTFLPTLGALTDANASKQSFNVISVINLEAPEADANVDKRAVLYFQDILDLSMTSLEVPAPKADIIESTPNGDRVKKSEGDAVATALNTATGKTYVFTHGEVYQTL